MTEEAQQQEEGSVDEEAGETQSSASRFWLTNDATALILVIGFLVTVWLHGAGWIDVTSIPGDTMTAFYAYVGIAITWAFGAGAVKAWRGK